MVPVLARFRQLYERVSLPLGRLCMRLGLTADMLTYISLAWSALAAVLLAKSFLYWSIGAILLMGAADVLDGATARAAGTDGDPGTILDHVSDRYAEFFLLGGVLLSGTVQPVWVLFGLFGMVMASYVRARAEATGKIASCNVGFAGRQEKLALLLVGLATQPLWPGLPILEWAVIAIGIASHITAVQRLAYSRRLLLGAQQHADLHQGSGLA